jgi:putative transposase
METKDTVGRLTDEGIRITLARCNVTPVGQALIRTIRESEPATAPLSSRERRNVTGIYPSSFMCMGLQIGSIIPDLLLYVDLDNRQRHPDLLEFWSRPTTIPNIAVIDSSGRCVTKKAYRPKVLCIREERVHFLDLLDDKVMLASEAKGHSLYQRTPDGRWISPAVTEALVPLGIGHEIWARSQFGKYYASNVSFLSSVFRGDQQPPDRETVKRIIERVESDVVVYRRELVADGIDADAIKWVIGHQLVFFPLEDEDLTNIEMCRLYLDRTAYLDEKSRRSAEGAGPPLSVRTVLPRTGQYIDWHGAKWLVANAGAEFTITNDNGSWREIPQLQAQKLCDSGAWQFMPEPEPLLTNTSPKRREEAAEKLALLSKPSGERFWSSGPKRGKPVSESTLNRIKSTVAKADAAGTSRLLALANGYDNCGDHTARVDGEIAIWRQSLKEDYKQKHRPRYASAYPCYLNRCKAAGVVPVSETTARRRLTLEDKAVIVESQNGELVAYQRGKYTPRDKSNNLVKGRIPWEVAHVDHAKIEVEVRSCITGEVMKRPIWRTVLRDACTFRVLGLVVFFGAPSYVALYRLILDVSRRFGRLPQYIISDRGLEFLSNQWETTLAEYGVCKLNRPAKTPRAGQPAESGNRKDDLQIVTNLPGNKLGLPDFRMLTAEFRPENNAVLSLGTIREAFERVYFDVEPRYPTSRTNGENLQDYETRLLRDVGTSHIPNVPYSSNLRILCMPSVVGRSGERVVTAQGSVECNTLEYFSPELQQPGVVGKFVVVHYDPDNVAHVFAWLGRTKGWAECRCNAYEVLSQFTPAELDEYTAHLRQQGCASKVEKRRNRAMAYAEVLEQAKHSKVLIHMHEVARENAHGFPGFSVIDDVVEVDLPRRRTSSAQEVSAADVEKEAEEMAQY